MSKLVEPKQHRFSIITAYAIAEGHEKTASFLYAKYREIWSNEITDHNNKERHIKIQGLGFQIVTNYAFCIEIYLKILCFQQIGSYTNPANKKNHSIVALSKILGEDVFKALETEYLNQLQQSELPDSFLFQINFNDDKPSEFPDFTTYEAAINYIDNSYARWRYIYEEFTETFNVSVVLKPFCCVAEALKVLINQSSVK